MENGNFKDFYYFIDIVDNLEKNFHFQFDKVENLDLRGKNHKQKYLMKSWEKE